jgi:3-hydroxybutyryl-CoA dehydrogenase
VVVVGAGLMGVGLAQVFATAGHSVVLVEQIEDCRVEAPARLRNGLDFLVGHSLLDPATAAAALGRVQVSAELSAVLRPAPLLAIEAITEDLAAKQDLMCLLDRETPAETLLASNTSGLSITALAEGLRRPERMCGLHFWNPPHLIPLVEVVAGKSTSTETLERAASLLRAAGKRPVLVKRDIPGFIGNRLLHALQREAMSLVEQGVASAADIDLVVTQGFGRRLGVVGPLAVCDLAGLDLVLEVDTYLLPCLETSPEPSPALHRLVDQGNLGVKTGQGFFPWPVEEVQRVLAERDEALLAALARDRRDNRATESPA